MSTSRRGIHLEYSFAATPADQRGASLTNPLVDLLRTLRDSGSISAAARALGSSYRHTWGALKQWEQVLGAELVVWIKGQPARLTPLAERLLWAETRASQDRKRNKIVCERYPTVGNGLSNS